MREGGLPACAAAAPLVGLTLPAVTINDVKSIVDILGTLVTAGAIIIGGLWAYFKFVKGRTFRPRLEVDMQGEWCTIGAERWLQARVRVKNIGASDVRLEQKGTGLRVSQMLPVKPDKIRAQWQPISVFSVLEEHQWIEPGETVSDDLLLRLDVPAHQPVCFEGRFVWQWKEGEGNIDVTARKIITADAKLETPHATTDESPS